MSSNYLGESGPGTMDSLDGFLTRGRNVVGSDSHQRSVFLMKFCVDKWHLFCPNNMPFPEAGETG